ncbi:flagellar basal body L-ring protein FlgH [Allorhizobium sp. BGMRC 0089]|uniref:flagellar basal body L-ring protein FlgH n=1 Tax=Allorhizobium sonneratiae TaxID=2934936 RepID=UPI002034060F|nr:flagellar basal body L-ring protein FlgH [Allorhizobium sonneratiae]MCM2291396.1 flagellar basal body L-ring protein FlgH [Allorhizobium sonneratiae]
MSEPLAKARPDHSRQRRSSSLPRLVGLLLISSALAGCGNTQTNRDIGNAPAMSPVGSGLRYSQAPQLNSYPKQAKTVTNGYSLWNDRQAALFKDSRAINVGDLLTVTISINDKAKFSNDTSRSRKNSTSLTWNTLINLFGLKTPDGTGNLGTDSNTSTDGKGSIDRSETLNLKIAAVVTGILENGNLLISGSQEVRVNQEMRILNVAGIVRPQDVDSSNTISYDKIAEARISYGGRGRLTEVQQPPVGQQIVDMYSPF